MSDLEVLAGQRSLAGHKEKNEDSLALVIPAPGVIRRKGVVAVIADGVSASECGGEAAEVAVRTFVQDYYSTPDTWRVQKSLMRVMSALNRWLCGQSLRALGEARGYVCTFSGIILKAGFVHVFHVGDSRVWLFRNGVLSCLTRDHLAALGDHRTYLSRALGLDVSLEVDYTRKRLHKGDLLMLSTDGLHGFLGSRTLEQHLARALQARSPESLEACCEALLKDALVQGSDDNLSVQLIRVLHPGEDALPEPTDVAALRFPPLLDCSDELDGYIVEAELHASERSQVYRVRDTAGTRYVMKTPAPRYADDAAYIERFLMESWAGRRIQHPHVVRMMARPDSPWLYTLTEWIEGCTLEDWMAHHHQPDVRKVLQIIRQVAEAVRALHRRDMFHGDLKPANVMVDAREQIKLVDFGSVWVGGLSGERAAVMELPLGTIRYSAPEYQQGQPPTLRSELFSLAVMTYEMLTGQHPYGELWEQDLSVSRRLKLEYIPAWRHNPLIPAWVDAALAKALRLDPRQRYDSLSEWLQDLSRPNRALVPEAPLPLLERDPVRAWQGIAALLAVLWVATLVALLG